MKILLVEDDEGAAEILRTTLIEQHYLVDMAMDGRAGLQMAKAFTYDLILLDVMLPKLDGLDFCRQLRENKDFTPVLLVTALNNSTSKIIGLDAGADDYVVKPFDTHELLARIRALIRRGSSALSAVIKAGNIRLDSSSCRVTCDGKFLHLTAKEYALIELLLRNSHRIFSQQALLDHLWSSEEIPLENTIRTHIKTLRQKLKQAGADGLIETVYGLGYRLKLGEDEVKSQAAATAHSQSASIAVTTLGQPRQQISPALAAIWERYKHKYSDHITTLEQAITTLHEGRHSQELGQQARGEAHLLIGSLASFGFTEASQICREIEQIFRAGVEPRLAEARHLSQLVVALRQELKLQAKARESHDRSLATAGQQRRLLIVDKDTQLGEQLISEATIWGIQAELATNLTKARKAIAQNCPDVVLLDLCFDNCAQSGLNLLAELTTNNKHLPVLVFAAQSDFANRIKVARLGGQIFLPKPVVPASVMAAVTQVLRQSDIVEAKILVVDDDPQMLDILRTILEPWGVVLKRKG
jgi:DNA-binding response OmpR family regulator/HPt (histidine-containing phosphotransfer) domain-containing protein